MAALQKTEPDQRIHPRSPTDLPVRLLCYGEAPREGRLLDLSKTGALIGTAVDGLRRGDEVLIDLGIGRAAVATIMWVTDAFCGANFHRPIANDLLSSMKAAPAIRAFH